MLRKLTSLLLTVMCFAAMSAQDLPPVEMLTPLPLNPKVKTGKLPNGLTYFILHNEEPKQRANFYIAQKVGSTLETPEQLGLAHFLEHMAFNGTTNFPGKDMLNYLQAKGIRFGADINAYTGFDQTVYNINNVPTTDTPLMDSVLLVLRDWSDGILLETEEINAERGVIQEEWRMRNSADFRMYSEVLPKIFKEYQYQQLPIGKMEVVMNFDPQAIRDYYKKWYRPDLQGIVIVGDVDVEDMERKIKDLFSTVVMPKGAAKRNYASVSDNKEPIVVNFTDPELRTATTIISFKSEKLPVEYRSTLEMYLMEDLMKEIIMRLLDNRLAEFGQEADCAYTTAGVYFGDFYVAKTKDSFNIVVNAKNDIQKAVSQAMAIVMRACKTGFTYSELQRVQDEMMANVEKAYNERDKTNNDRLASQIIDYFVNNNPYPGIEAEYQILQQAFMALPLEAINQTVPAIVTPDNMVVVSSIPQAGGFNVIAENVMTQTINDAMNAEYEPYVDEVITEPLIANLPKPGKVNEVKELPEIGASEYILSNGVKVILKTTDFSADEVLLTAYRKGGKEIYTAEQAPNVEIMDMAFDVSKWGPFDNKMFMKFLSGKRVGLSLNVDTKYDELSGFSTVKDLPTLMEMIYTAFTNLSPDQETYNVNAQRMATQLSTSESNPDFIFGKNQIRTLYGNNPLMDAMTLESFEKANYIQALDMVHAVLKNAAEYTFVFTGNIDNATIRPLLEQYIATLPVALRKKVKIETPIETVKGQVFNEFKQPMQTPATHVFDFYSGDNLKYEVKNSIMTSFVGQILGNILTETLREEEGGTYSPYAVSSFSPESNQWGLIYYFITNADQQASLIKRANDELEKLLTNGSDAVNFNKVKEASIKQYEINSHNNKYWNGIIPTQLKYPEVPIVSQYEATLSSITLDEFNSFMKNLYNGKNRVQVIMEGVPAE